MRFQITKIKYWAMQTSLVYGLFAVLHTLVIPTESYIGPLVYLLAPTRVLLSIQSGVSLAQVDHLLESVSTSHFKIGKNRTTSDVPEPVDQELSLITRTCPSYCDGYGTLHPSQPCDNQTAPLCCSRETHEGGLVLECCAQRGRAIPRGVPNNYQCVIDPEWITNALNLVVILGLSIAAISCLIAAAVIMWHVLKRRKQMAAAAAPANTNRPRRRDLSVSSCGSCSTCMSRGSTRSVRSISNISTISSNGSFRRHQRTALERPGQPPPYQCTHGAVIDLSHHPTGIVIITEPIPPPNYEDILDPPPPYFLQNSHT